jgi:hypothetical protein
MTSPSLRPHRQGQPSGLNELSRRVGDVARRFLATIHWRYGHHGPVEGPASPGSTAPSPDEGGGGLAPAQPLPAAAPASHHDHRRALLGHCHPSSSPWPATAGPTPPPAAQCRAPDTAGRRSCRTADREYGRPGNARRRSAACTDRCRRAWASKYSGRPCRAPSRARWRSPRADGSSGASRGLTALGLVARLQPTHQAGGHGPAGAASLTHRTPPPVWSAGQSLGRPVTRRRRPTPPAPWPSRSPLRAAQQGSAWRGRHRSSTVRLGPFPSAGGTQLSLRSPCGEARSGLKMGLVAR